MDEYGSIKFRALAFVCALLVVPIHCFSLNAWFVGESTLSAWETAICCLCSDTVSRCAVPVFFGISGFFLALKYRPGLEWYLGLLKKKFFALYVPFVLWNAFYLVRAVLLRQIAFPDGYASLIGMAGRVTGLDFTSPPGYNLFWFVRALLMAFVVSPLILPLLRKTTTTIMLMSILFLGWIAGTGLYEFDLGNYMWMCIGAVLAFRLEHVGAKNTLQSKIHLALVLVLAGSVVSKVVCAVVRSRFLYGMFDRLIVASGFMVAFMWVLRRSENSLSWWLYAAKPLFPFAFFIYIFHPQGLMVHYVLEVMHMPELAVYFGKIAFGAAVPIVVGLGLRHIAPQFFGVLTGGRA